MHRTITTTLCAAVLSLAAFKANAEEPLITGTATYEISVDTAKTSVVGSVTGTMTQTLRRLCGGYASEMALSADFGALDGSGTIPLRVAISHREEGDQLKFDVAGKIGPVELERARGSASKTSEGLLLALVSPAAEMHEIKGRVLFPIEMIKELLRAANAGEKFVEFRVFDGSGQGREVWTTSVMIGAARKVAESDEEKDFADAIGVADLKRWPIRISYFGPTAEGEQMPAFTAEATVYENGFSSAAVYDYGQFALRLRLVEFRPLTPEPCPREVNQHRD